MDEDGADGASGGSERDPPGPQASSASSCLARELGGGGQIGYNFRTGAFVFGVEADIQYADLSSKANWGGYNYSFDGGGSQYFGTVRARVGYAIDRVLVYVTGGRPMVG